MNMSNQPLPLKSPPDPVDSDLEPLLREPFGAAWADNGAAPLPEGAAVRLRLLDRLAKSRAEAAPMFTARRARLPSVTLAPGVQARTLYQASDTSAPRPGEPLQARLIELTAGAQWAGPGSVHHREWLVLKGSVVLGEERLALRDYHVATANSASPALFAQEAALLFLRESVAPPETAAPSFTVRDAEPGWSDFAPGIQRRVLWQHAGQAAMLYYVQPGVEVPLHTHGHDEECLMVQGELLLDDVLLQSCDYQLAPAGTDHRITQTDTGAVLYVHGDLDLKFVA